MIVYALVKTENTEDFSFFVECELIRKDDALYWSHMPSEHEYSTSLERIRDVTKIYGKVLNKKPCQYYKGAVLYHFDESDFE